jgi:hypothetical protein
MILSFRKFTKSHSAKNISSFIEKELNKLNIIDKVVSITTDNEAAVALAGSTISNDLKRISCMCHNLNLAIKNGLKLWIKPK